MNEAKKPVLPHGWIVKQSSTYPDRVYYFNVNTGNSTWEAPTLKSELVRSIRVILNILLNESVISKISNVILDFFSCTISGTLSKFLYDIHTMF
jgi:hypothetical protein